MATHWNRRPRRWTTPLLALTALLAVAPVVVHVLGQGHSALNSTGGLRNILGFAAFVMAFVTYVSARRP